MSDRYFPTKADQAPICCHYLYIGPRTALYWTLDKTNVKGFDVAYASEGLARAHAVVGNREQSDAPKEKAQQLVIQIAGDGNRKIFEGDLEEW